MTVVGPQTGYAVLLVFLEVSAGLGAIAVLSHPHTLSHGRRAELQALLLPFNRDENVSRRYAAY